MYNHDSATCLASQKLCVDSANPCVNVDLIVWANHPQELTTFSGTNTYLDLKTILRDSTLPNPLVTTPVIAIKSMVALDSIFVLLQATTIQRMSPDVPGIDVQVVPDPSSLSSPPYYTTFFHPDGFRCDYPTGCPNPKRELGAYPTDAETAVASTYNFLILDAGGGSPGVLGDVTVDAANTSPERDDDQRHRLHRPAPAERRRPHPHDRLHHRHGEGAFRRQSGRPASRRRSCRRTAT